MSLAATLSQKIRAREPILGIWMQIPHSIVAETLAQTGADFLLVDGEHAPIPPDVLHTLLPGIERHGMPSLYRVRWNRTELIKGALDAGASAIMVPMVNSAAEAREAVAAAKYPPQGKRGIGAWRASNYYLDHATYMARANTDIAVVLQIETKEAMAAIEEIAAVPGVDALYIGPGDLALSLGIPPGELHPDLLAACKRVSEVAKTRGLAAGIDVASLDFVPTYHQLGFSLLTYGSDFGFIVDGGRGVVGEIKKARG